MVWTKAGICEWRITAELGNRRVGVCPQPVRRAAGGGCWRMGGSLQCVLPLPHPLVPSLFTLSYRSNHPRSPSHQPRHRRPRAEHSQTRGPDLPRAAHPPRQATRGVNAARTTNRGCCPRAGRLSTPRRGPVPRRRPMLLHARRPAGMRAPARQASWCSSTAGQVCWAAHQDGGCFEHCSRGRYRAAGGRSQARVPASAATTLPCSSADHCFYTGHTGRQHGRCSQEA